MIDWGVPDWRDASAYPRLDDVSLFISWWEFTRRRPDYRELWITGRAGSSTDSLTGETEYYPEDRHSLALKFKLNVLLDPTQTHSLMKLSSHHYSLNASAPVGTASKYEGMAEVWRMVGDVDAETIEHIIDEEKAKSRAAGEAGIMLYSFDVSQPLAPQLDRAAATLEFWQERRFQKLNTRRPSRELWSLYLRALDAADAGATPTEMTSVFWLGLDKKPSQAASTLKLARAVRDNFPI